MSENNQQRQARSGLSRRELLSTATATAATLTTGLAALTPGVVSGQSPDEVSPDTKSSAPQSPTSPSIIGDYGSWASTLVSDPAELSFLRDDAPALDVWRKTAMSKASELIASPDIKPVGDVTIVRKANVDGLTIEELQWQLPYGHPTKAILLKPAGATRPLPAVLALHDHGWQQVFRQA